jgi:hypothetical protein
MSNNDSNIHERPQIEKPDPNVWKDEPKIILASEGRHDNAEIVATSYKGKSMTRQYGEKDWQLFVVRVSQLDDRGNCQTVEIHQPMHRSLQRDSALVRFMKALGMSTVRGQTLDFNSFIGKKLSIMVRHDRDANGILHANFVPFKAGQSRVGIANTPRLAPVTDEVVPEFITCADDDCTNFVSAHGEFCERHREQQARFARRQLETVS